MRVLGLYPPHPFSGNCISIPHIRWGKAKGLRVACIATPVGKVLVVVDYELVDYSEFSVTGSLGLSLRVFNFPNDFSLEYIQELVASDGMKNLPRISPLVQSQTECYKICEGLDDVLGVYIARGRICIRYGAMENISSKDIWMGIDPSYI